MAKKPNSFNPFGDDATAAQFAESVRASAQQIWLAGLGAFAKAQAEGSKMFDNLVKEGAGMQGRSEAGAQGLHEAGARMGSMAGELGARAAGQWDRLEGIFEERVAKALRRLGVPRIEELEMLAARVEALERATAQSPKAARRTTAKTAGKTARTTAPRPAAAKRAPRKRAGSQSD